MAKNKLTYEIDIEGLQNIQKNMQSLQTAGGELGKEATKILTNVDKILSISNEFGKSIPLTEMKKIKELYDKISAAGTKISNMQQLKIFSEKDTQLLDKYNDSLAKMRQNIVELKKELNKPFQNSSELQKILNQKTIQKDGKTISLDALDKATKKSRNSLTIKELEGYSHSGDAKTAAAATAVLEKYNKVTKEYQTNHAKVQEDLDSATTSIETLTKAIDSLNAQIRKVTDGERQAGESAAKWSADQAENTERTRKAVEKTGATEVEVTKKTEEHAKTLGTATSRVIRYGITYQLFRKVLRETINTVKEMDAAITGMTVVTGMSRQEAESYISTIQEISAATSTAMTDIANLTTEYLRQGRAMKDALTLAEETAKAAKISGLSTSDTIQYMTAAINGFNLAATDATRVSDIFSNLAATSATNYENLAIALSKVSAQANLAGMSIEYTSALLAKGMETTQEAPESIGTALKTVIARMRELSDYGSTLEDGANVNKVEAALKSAGIQLRTTTGEFRDLEQVFNELGPKWDQLNSNQQQAIAQAVAGTRQQSRFIAIMQDWGRTQELVTEAQDSAGASAAQYAQYAKGMEAAITKLQTAYQGFIQEISNSKLIIGIIRGIADFIDSAPGKFTLITTVVLGGIKGLAVVFDQLRIRLDKFLEVSNQIHSVQNENTEAVKEEVDAVQKRNEELKKTLQLQLQLNQKNALTKEEKQRLMAPKQERMNQLSAQTSFNQTPEEYQQQMEASMDNGLTEYAQQQIEAYKKNYEEYKQLQLEIHDIEQGNIYLQEEQKNNQESQYRVLSLMDEQQRSILEARMEDNNAQIEANNLALERLNVERDILQAKLEQTKSDEERAALQSQINDIDSSINKYTEDNVALNTKNDTLLANAVKQIGKQNSVLNTLVNKVAHKYGVSVNQIKNTFQTITGLVKGVATHSNKNNISLSKTLEYEKGILNSYEERKKALEAAKGDQQAIDRLTKQIADKNETIKNLESAKNALQEDDLVSKNTLLKMGVQENDLAEIAKTTEQATTVEQQTQETLQNKTNLEAATGVATAQAEQKVEESQTATKTTNAGMDMAGSAAKIPFVGWIIGAAILASLGIAALATSIPKWSDNNKTDKIADSQTAIYNTKKSNKEIKSNYNDYAALYNKSVKTQEDYEKMEELEETIAGLDDTFKNKTGKQLLDAMNNKMAENTASIRQQINSNLKTASKLSHLYDSNVGIQAVQSALVQSTNELIDSNSDLQYAVASGTVDSNSINTKVNNLAEEFATQWAKKQEELTEQLQREYNDMMAHGNQSYSNYDSQSQYVNKKLYEAGYSQSNLKEATYEFAKTTSEFVTKMSLAGDNLGEQLKAYNQNTASLNDFQKGVIDSQYGTLAYLNNLSTLTTESGQNFSDVITKLSDVDKVSSQAIVDITQAILDLKQGSEDDWETTTNESNNKLLEDLRVELGLSSTASAAEIQAAYAAAYKADENGKVDGKDVLGNWKDSDSTRQATYDLLGKIASAETATGTEGMSQEGKTILEKMNSAQAEETFQSALMTYLGNVSGDLTKDSSAEDVAAAYLKYREDLAPATQIYKDTLDEAWQNYLDADEENKAQKLNDYKIAYEEYAKKMKEVDDAVYGAGGYLDASSLNDLLTTLQSSANNVVDLKNKLFSGEELDLEDWEKVRTEIIPELQSYAEQNGIEFDADVFTQSLAEGGMDAIELLNTYYDSTFTNSQDTLDANLLQYEQKVKDAQKEVEYAKHQLSLAEATGEYDKIIRAQKNLDTAQGAVKTAQANLAVLRQTKAATEKITASIKGRTNEEIELYSLEERLEKLQNKDDTLQNLQDQLSIQERLNKKYKEQLANKYKEFTEINPKLTAAIKKNADGTYSINKEMYQKLGDEQRKMVDTWIENIETYNDTVTNSNKSLVESYNAIYEQQKSLQDQAIDAYKTKLQAEQDAVKESLDARRSMYEKYFDAINQEDETEDYETQRAKLENAIAALSTATDATSLQKLKDYQKQLTELDDSYNQSLREQMQEATLANIDNEATMIDDYYETMTTDAQTMWESIKGMGEQAFIELITSSNEEYRTSTDMNKDYLLASYKDLWQEIETGNKGTAVSGLLETWAKNGNNKYANGGLVDYTGPAWVDGTTSHPEAFLNADQTALFSNLAATLSNIYTAGGTYSTEKDKTSSVSIDSINISVNGSVDATIADATGQSMADAFLEGLVRNGISINRR